LKETIPRIRCTVKDNHIDLAGLMDELGKKNITSILFEGGAALMGSMIRERLIDKFMIFRRLSFWVQMTHAYGQGKGAHLHGWHTEADRTKIRKVGSDISLPVILSIEEVVCLPVL
jgi:diaminohydroxyphosphoribosylaminopyrimidine deaminase/5-amino-6-(5-phosphoribosylamino)uracil reductase